MNTYSYIIVNQEIIIKIWVANFKNWMYQCYTYLKDCSNIVKTIKSTHNTVKCFDKISQKENGTHSDWVSANINTIKLLNLQLYV